MPPLLSQAVKFAGFAGKTAEETGEVASFFKSLGIGTKGSIFAEKTDTFSFVHEAEVGKRVTYLKQGEELLGELEFNVENPAAPRVSAAKIYNEANRGKGLGLKMYKGGIENIFATMPEAMKVTSDVLLGSSESAKGVWKKMGKAGYDVRPSAPLRLPGVGAFVEEPGFEISRQSMMKLADQTAQDMLMSGAGNDNTSLLRRGLKSVNGSRKTSAAL